MAFPTDEIALRVEMLIGSSWTDVTDDVRAANNGKIIISEGSADEASSVSPSKCSFSIASQDGKYAPRNPRSPYYGQIGRNTPLRVSVVEDESHVWMCGDASNSYISTPDSVALSLTGDIDIRVEIRQDNWGEYLNVLSKWGDAGNRSWQFSVVSGYLKFYWSPDGTSAISVTSDEALPIPANKQMAVSVTFEQATSTVKFWYSDSIDGSYTQLGSTSTTSTAATVYDSTAPVIIGHYTVSDPDVISPYAGRIIAAELRGAGGTLVASPDPAPVAEGSASWADAQGNTWTCAAGACVSRAHWLHHGEVSEWPVTWDVSLTDATVGIVSSGILRRIGQGTLPVRSAIRRAIESLVDPPVAYWPCEDGEDADSVSASIGTAMTYTGTPTFASSDAFACSDKLPKIGSSELYGKVPYYTDTGFISLRALVTIPSGGLTSGGSILDILNTGTSARWRLWYSTGGSVYISVYDSVNGLITSLGPYGWSLNGKSVQIELALSQDGSDVDWVASFLEPGSSTGYYNSGTVSSYSIGRATGVFINRLGQLGGDFSAGHVTVRDDIQSIWNLNSALTAHDGESASFRFRRLSYENGIPFRYINNGKSSTALGVQKSKTFSALIKEIRSAENGMLSDDRFQLGLRMRSHRALMSQPVSFTFDLATSGIHEMLPTPDDRGTENDVTVERTNGGSSRAILETGSMSVQDYPDGIGRYDNKYELNLSSDSQTMGIAHWMLNVGTIDEERYPSVTLFGEVFSATDLDLIRRIQVGDRIDFTNMPQYVSPIIVRQQVLGITQTIKPYSHEYMFNLAPYSPWEAGRWGRSVWATDDTELASALNDSATSFTISGDEWSTTSTAYPIGIIVGVEPMTLTAVSGSPPSQSMTVVRGAGGYAYSHPAGDSVRVDPSARYAY